METVIGPLTKSGACALITMGNLKRILILAGAGRMSSGTARDLLATYSHSIEKLIIADSSNERLDILLVADRLDRIDKMSLYWAAKFIGDENPILIPPYNLSTVLAEYGNLSQQFLNGKLQQVPAQSGFETIDLPEPFGKTSFIHSEHSEPLTVPFANAFKEKGIQEFTWKLSLPEREHQAWIRLVKAGFGETFDEDVTLPNGTSVRPVDVLQVVIDRNIERHKKRIPDQELHEIHFSIG
ncbi:unnamed protein product [Didymodactylos carnosus]|uniref:Uncharacterized protein n=1 Tax=Didymodactylos carnosus TaxID=1234261 RepID=A0A814S680_9BILA|nr:unnamed protein product [Didymodactylos carnosus]CAF3905587.1 unnamed protein product [Didymodactylos carnosus]